MPITVLQAAKCIGKLSGWSLSNLEMQKLLYIAHMFHLGDHNNPLVRGNFEAWDLGPVHPDLYHQAKVFGARPVENIFRSVPKLKEGTESDMLRETIKELKDLTGADLVAITHWEKGAWAKNYKPGVRNIIIPNADILAEYNLRSKDS